MGNTSRLDFLRNKYFLLSQQFLVALKNEKSSEELEKIRREVKAIVNEIEQLESSGQPEKDTGIQPD